MTMDNSRSLNLARLSNLEKTTLERLNRADPARKVIRSELTESQESRLDYSSSSTERRTREIQERLESLEKRGPAQRTKSSTPNECVEEEIQISLTKVEAGAVLNFFWGEWIPLTGRKEIQAVLRKLEEGLRSAQ